MKIITITITPMSWLETIPAVSLCRGWTLGQRTWIREWQSRFCTKIENIATPLTSFPEQQQNGPRFTLWILASRVTIYSRLVRLQWRTKVFYYSLFSTLPLHTQYIYVQEVSILVCVCFPHFANVWSCQIKKRDWWKQMTITILWVAPQSITTWIIITQATGIVVWIHNRKCCGTCAVVFVVVSEKEREREIFTNIK